MVASGGIFLVLVGNMEEIVLWEHSYISNLQIGIYEAYGIQQFDKFGIPDRKEIWI